MWRHLKDIYLANNGDYRLPARSLSAPSFFCVCVCFFCQMFSEAVPTDQRLFSLQICIKVYCLRDNLMWNIKRCNQNFWSLKLEAQKHNY